MTQIQETKKTFQNRIVFNSLRPKPKTSISPYRFKLEGMSLSIYMASSETIKTLIKLGGVSVLEAREANVHYYFYQKLAAILNEGKKPSSSTERDSITMQFYLISSLLAAVLGVSMRLIKSLIDEEGRSKTKKLEEALKEELRKRGINDLLTAQILIDEAHRLVTRFFPHVCTDIEVIDI
ncbi:hypothetical protein [Helicobacter sp. 11S02629-2]|uniref:hypothetical protein n=1 Tax=Helicobacter sp. 11S02629-2 TaxID=1476195 RepID=UPI000BA771E8|nr:hypothetical protein [Helicobacter sp. 11S02629-2]PAF44149.1 hypothetical protein BKH40_06015 [Helicobacter sp. 11S02629-2]